MCTTGGYYVVDIMVRVSPLYHIYVWAIGLTARVFCLLQDTYVSRYTLVIAGLCECLFVGWHYGAERLREETRRVSSSFKSYLRNL